MKKLTLTVLCLFFTLNAMDLPIQRTAQEWDAQAYAQGNTLQSLSFLHFLKTNNIKPDGLTILDAGCGTGDLTAILARTAQHVHGIDASHNMINYAYNQYKDIKEIDNVSFQHCFAEDFCQHSQLYQLAIMSSSFHWFTDKKMALHRINKILHHNGQLFANIITSNNPAPLNLVVFEEMKQSIPLIGQYLSNNTNAIGSSYPTTVSLNALLNETGFNVLKLEEQSFVCKMTENEIRLFQWPIVTSRPGIQYIPDFLIQPLFDNFIERCLKKLPYNDADKTYTYTHTATIVHAQKKQ